ncbi:MAG: hypothetical protein KAT35_02600 [Candidatus Aenigmarchaeota archaeon]|nr:hypothetical protein [Candidatus Aenigmarchaeota archaeon]
MAVDLVQVSLDFIVAFMGITTVVVLYLAKSKLSKGLLYSLMNWMFYSVVFFALPYSLIAFLSSAGFIVIADQKLVDLSARVFITLYFLSMLRAAFYAKSLSDLFGFKTFFPQQKDKPKNKPKT